MTYVQSAVYGGAAHNKGLLTLSSAAMMDLIGKKVAEHRHKVEFQRS